MVISVHKTGGRLPIHAPKCVKIITALLNLHNIAIDEKLHVDYDNDDNEDNDDESERKKEKDRGKRNGKIKGENLKLAGLQADERSRVRGHMTAMERLRFEAKEAAKNGRDQLGISEPRRSPCTGAQRPIIPPVFNLSGTGKRLAADKCLPDPHPSASILLSPDQTKLIGIPLKFVSDIHELSLL
ncbi:hypothetical protein CHS0354_019871 [Potamilus streckersoni]|uniref:Uncharacterized protein n=1 Tax=Potamilus streckersoni TaxID=2493646 RepID=A0AAE0SV02_9BIVA|nr:hypothetical protein CHS0354_019871 [Potamilus streckersoni]